MGDKNESLVIATKKSIFNTFAAIAIFLFHAGHHITIQKQNQI